MFLTSCAQRRQLPHLLALRRALQRRRAEPGLHAVGSVQAGGRLRAPGAGLRPLRAGGVRALLLQLLRGQGPDAGRQLLVSPGLQTPGAPRFDLGLPDVFRQLLEAFLFLK